MIGYKIILVILNDSISTITAGLPAEYNTSAGICIGLKVSTICFKFPIFLHRIIAGGSCM